MGTINRTWALILIGVIAISCLTILIVNPVDAQSLPIPAVPEFTVVVGVTTNLVPTTYSLNQSSGQIVAQLGYIEVYNSTTLVIKNQNSADFTTSSGDRYSLFYNVRVGLESAGAGWTELFKPQDYPIASSGKYTNISLPYLGGGTFDIQVQAFYGFWGRISTNFGGQGIVNQTESDWSSSKTATTESKAVTNLSPTPMPSSSPSVYPITTSSPISTVVITPNNSMSDNQQLTNFAFIITVAVLGVAVASLLVYVRRIKSRVNQLSKQ